MHKKPEKNVCAFFLALFVRPLAYFVCVCVFVCIHMFIENFGAVLENFGEGCRWIFFILLKIGFYHVSFPP